jgi:hypothetical protein
MSERIAFKSAGAVRKWGVRRLVDDRRGILGDELFAVLKFGKVIYTCADSGEAHRYVQDCVDLDRMGA